MQSLACQLRTTIRKCIECQYLLYLPDGGAKARRRKVPLLLFLHGAGERGKDLEKVKVHGPPRLIEEGRRFPFIVVAPQCRESRNWDPDVLTALLDRIAEEHPVDLDRVYVTGLSMGGQGTWALAAAAPERFAAAAPICAPLLWLPSELLKAIPIWCFHGAMDSVVPVDDSITMVRRLRRAGCDVRFTVYPDADHDSWSATYANPEFYDWLLAQKRQVAP